MLFRKLKNISNSIDKSSLNALSQASAIGLHMVSGITVGTLIGYFLDRWLETSPWLTGIFMLFGIVAGFKNVYVDTKRLVNSQNKEGQTPSPLQSAASEDKPQR